MNIDVSRRSVLSLSIIHIKSVVKKIMITILSDARNAKHQKLLVCQRLPQYLLLCVATASATAH